MWVLKKDNLWLDNQPLQLYHNQESVVFTETGCVTQIELTLTDQHANVDSYNVNDDVTLRLGKKYYECQVESKKTWLSPYTKFYTYTLYVTFEKDIEGE